MLFRFLTLERRVDGGQSGLLQLSKVAVGRDALLGADAGAALVRVLQEGAILAAAEVQGVLGRALDITFEYLKTRVQFGKPIGSFQALQHRSVDLFVQKELAIGAVADAINGLQVSAGDPLTMFAKLKGSIEGPLKGMSTAFGASLFGLSGSLVLGFLELQASQAQGRFHKIGRAHV